MQPANAATPAPAAFVVLGVQAKVAVPGLVSTSVTELVLPGTVFPKASCTLTVGWTANAVPPVPFPG